MLGRIAIALFSLWLAACSSSDEPAKHGAADAAAASSCPLSPLKQQLLAEAARLVENDIEAATKNGPGERYVKWQFVGRDDGLFLQESLAITCFSRRVRISGHARSRRVRDAAAKPSARGA